MSDDDDRLRELDARLSPGSREGDLLRDFRTLVALLHERTRRRFSRLLSVGDYVSDRWEKARALGFGEGTSIYDSSLVVGEVAVGKHTWIGPFTVLDGAGSLSIGDFCTISAGVHIYSHDTVKWSISGGTAPYENRPTRIGSRVYIGAHTVVAKGVTIGDGSIIGAHSLVLKDIPAGSKAYGQPCRVRGKVDEGAKTGR